MVVVLQRLGGLVAIAAILEVAVVVQHGGGGDGGCAGCSRNDIQVIFRCCQTYYWLFDNPNIMRFFCANICPTVYGIWLFG